MSRIGRTRLHIKFPKLRPKVRLERMECWITWNDSTAKEPFLRARNEFSFVRILQHVMAGCSESVSLSLVLAQDVIVRLMLKPMWPQGRAEMFAKELHAVALVGIQMKAHPD